MALLRSTDKLVEGLSNRFFTDQRAQDALSSTVSSLSSQILAEQSARQSADSAEQSARQSADSALSGRLDVVEGSGVGSIAKSLQDAKDYADGIVLSEKNLRETIEAQLDGRLDVIEGSGAGSIAKSLVDAKAYADQKVSDLINGAPAMLDTLKEIADQLANDESAVSALTSTVATNLQTAKDYADAAVLVETQARQSAVSGEASSRQSADSALSGRLDALEADSTTQTYVDQEISGLQGQISQEVSDRQSAVSAEQTRAMSAEGALDGRLDILEQDPVTKTYTDGEISAEQSARQAAVSAEQSRAQGAEAALSGRLDVLEVDPTSKGYVDSQVSAEQTRAQNAESALDGRLDILEQDPVTKSYTDSQISAEQSARQSAVSSEQSARQSADSALSLRLDALELDPTSKSYVDSQVSAEQGARQSADSALSGRLDVIEGSGAGSVAKAEQDAKNYADQKVADLINGAPAMLDTLKEIADQLASDESAVMALTNTVATNLQTAKDYADAAVASEQSARITDVNAEESRAMAAEALLSGRLSTLETDPTTKAYVDSVKSNLQGQITQEVSDRQGAVSSEASARQSADTALSGRISTLEADPTTKSYVDAQVSAEASARSAEDLTMFKKDGSRAMTGQFQAIDGTVSAPGISFSSGSNTGIYKTGTGTGQIMYFAINGSAKFTVDPAGAACGGRLQMTASSSANMLWSFDGGGDIGASSASRPNNLYIKNSIVNAGSESVGTTLTMAGASGANMLWTTDGGGSIGASSANRPNHVYAKGSVQASAMLCTTQITLSGSQVVRYAGKSADYTLTVTDYMVGITDASAPRTMTLPSSGLVSGLTYVVKDASGAASNTNYIKVTTSDAKTIDGSAEYKLVAPYEAATFVYNGSNWMVL